MRAAGLAWSTGRVAEPDVSRGGAPSCCSLCGHAWSAHFGGGPTAVWVTCCATPAGTVDEPAAGEPGDAPGGIGGAGLPVAAGLGGPAVTCYCRRGVEEFRAEAPAGADGTVLCVTCGVVPAQDTQCRGCREARQQASRSRFAARQARLGRGPRRR